MELTINKTGRIYIKLEWQRRKRNIGTIKDGVYTKHTKYIHNKTDSFGFCYEAIKRIEPHAIVVHYGGHTYSIDIDRFYEYKFFLHFNKQGYELQCFVPRKYFTIVK